MVSHLVKYSQSLPIILQVLVWYDVYFPSSLSSPSGIRLQFIKRGRAIILSNFEIGS
ncbi:MAG TPA: hypothetical protein VN704_01925 [Verrucomicrobiae bacterium]|nr:hypothetical protein [Verrucomicrobiae bacterium]